MVTAAVLRQIALSLPEVIEQPHFEKTSYRVAKKIFATIAPDGSRAMAKLSRTDQDLFCTSDRKAIYPVPNKWGERGGTYLNLAMINKEMLTEILKCAYKEVAPKRLNDLVTFDD